MSIQIVKDFIKDHKSEIVALSIAAVATGIVIHFRMKNFVEITDVMKDEMSNGDLTRFIHQGTEYAMSMNTYKPV